MTTADEIRNRFAFHPADTHTARERHQDIRELCKGVALAFNEMLPESREKSLALTALQEAMMWGNAAVAIHGGTGKSTTNTNQET
jgi:hypothetical protein